MVCLRKRKAKNLFTARCSIVGVEGDGVIAISIKLLWANEVQQKDYVPKLTRFPGAVTNLVCRRPYR